MLKKIGIIGIGLVIVIAFCIGAKSCMNRGSKNTQSGSSINNNSFVINAPSNLIATAVSPYQINLSWQDNSNNEDGFEIERSINGLTYTLLSVLNANATFYSDITTTYFNPFVGYYYRIRAFNSIGDRSSYSNEVLADTSSLQPEWSMVNCGNEHSFAVTTDGFLWAWGKNNNGQLGFGGTANSYPIPNWVREDFFGDAFDNIGMAKGGDLHSFALKTDPLGGTLWGWGVNGGGQLGTGDTDSFDWPYQVVTDSDWSVVIAARGNYSLGVKTNGTLYSWGYNDSNQLGFGDTLNRLTPTQIDTASDWANVFTADRHSVGLKTNGSIYSWGSNFSGQLGVGDSADRDTPSQIGSSSNWSTIAVGNFHTLGCKANGTIWAWGNNDYGQLGLGLTGVNKFTPVQVNLAYDWASVAAGYRYSVGRKTNGTIYSWGNNDDGQLGLGDIIQRNTPAQIGTDCDWSIIVSGYGHSIGMKTNAIIWVWGVNNWGQLGLGDTINRIIPHAFNTPTPPISLIGTIASGTQINLSWTDRSYNEQGFIIERSPDTNTNYNIIASVGPNIVSYSDNTVTNQTFYYYRVKAYNISGFSGYSNEVRLFIPVKTGYAKIACGGEHTLVIRTSGIMQSCGRNNAGQLGQGDNRDKYYLYQVGTGLDWVIISGGSGFSFARKSNGKLYSWGANSFGKLGLGDEIDRNTPTQVDTTLEWSAISLGYDHTIAVKTNNTMYSWGWNSYAGQLGLGDFVNRDTPSQIGTASDWRNASVGAWHSLACKTDGTVYSWGNNDSGQLGDDGTDRNSPVQIGIVSDWSMVFAGRAHSITLKTNRTIYSWGENYCGQLGLGNTGSGTNRNTPTQIGTFSDWNQIALGYIPSAFAFTSYDHCIGKKTNGTIYSWGDNNYGQLGLGNSGFGTNKFSPTQIGIDSDWIEISAGAAFSIGLKKDTTIYSWGRNDYGQLGLGDTVNRNTPAQIGIAFLPAPPAILTATTISFSQINLSWTEVTGELGYKIERSLTPLTGYVTAATVLADITSYSDTGLDSYLTYYYRVRAYNNDGNGDYSPEVNATTLIGPPLAPNLLSVSVISRTRLDIIWSDVNGETGYRIERSVTSSTTGYSQLATIGADTVSYPDTTVVESTTYYYKVCAFNAWGDGVYSNVISATTPAAPPPFYLLINAVQPPTGHANEGNMSLGYRFSPSVNGSITGLARYIGNGFTGNTTVILWQEIDATTGTELARVTVSPDEGWQWETLATPIPVSTSQVYRVAVTCPGTDYWYDAFAMPVSLGNINIYSSCYGEGIDAYPSDTENGNMYGWADIEFVEE